MKLVFIHGLGQTSDSWNEVINYVDVSKTIRISLGKLARESKSITFAEMSGALTKKLEAIKEPFILIGLSLGGCFALQQGLSNDINLKGLVVSGAQYSMSNSRKIRLIFSLQKYIFKLMSRKYWKKQGIDKTKINSLYSSMQNFDLSNQLHQITTPTLVMIGSLDKVNFPASKDIAEKIPKANLKIIKEGKHELNTQKPKQFANAINEFVKSIE